MKVRDIMATELVALRVDEEMSLASDIMTLGRIRHLPIVKGDTLVGIISQRDLFKASLTSVMENDYQKARDHLKTVMIKDVMIKDVFTIAPDTEIHEAGLIMLEKKIGCLPVIQDGVPIGMVTETDILKFYVLRHQNKTGKDI